MSNDDGCLNCEFALVCEAAPYKFAQRLAVMCRDHRFAFTNITQAEATECKNHGREAAFNWMDHTTFSRSWNVPCPCVLLRACPKFTETSDIRHDAGDVLRVNFKIIMDEPLDKINLVFKPFANRKKKK